MNGKTNHVMLRSVFLAVLLFHAVNGHDHGHGHVHGQKESVGDTHDQKAFDHDSILGDKHLSGEFDDLPPEEAKKRLRKLVTDGGMDVNGDGFVDKAELSEWVDNSFHSLSREDASARMKEDDENKDGLVSWAEYIKDNFDLDSNEEDAELMKEDKLLWEAADSNGDNHLNIEEYTAFNAPEEYSQMHEALYKISMSKRDKNKDGEIDLKEFMSEELGSEVSESSDTYVMEKDKFEKEYDLDKNGKLNEKEVKRWIIPDQKELADTEAEHLLSAADKNNDGKLTVDEIVDNYDVFVGSEATDFGEQLYKQRDEL